MVAKIQLSLTNFGQKRQVRQAFDEAIPQTLARAWRSLDSCLYLIFCLICSYVPAVPRITTIINIKYATNEESVQNGLYIGRSAKADTRR
jgi:hypothetical protein